MGIWNDDDRKDIYEITDEKVKKNTNCVAAICMKDNLIDNNGFSTLRVKNYGKSFNLCDVEPFYDQPISAGRLATGFLVKEDVIATAGSFVNESKIADFRIIFGYRMVDNSAPVIQMPNNNIYKAVGIINRVYNPRSNGSDWALVKLDRRVEGQTIARLSEKDIYCHQPVYIIGYPVGLPLKYSGGAIVRDIEDTFFSADIDVYSGNAGSPVFDSNTHEVIGIVVRGDTQDFRWTGKGWLSIKYSNPHIHSREPQCTKVSEFIAYC